MGPIMFPETNIQSNPLCTPDRNDFSKSSNSINDGNNSMVLESQNGGRNTNMKTISSNQELLQVNGAMPGTYQDHSFIENNNNIINFGQSPTKPIPSPSTLSPTESLGFSY